MSRCMVDNLLEQIHFYIECFVTGHDFSRAVNAAKSTWALAPEGCFSLYTIMDFALVVRMPEKELADRIRGFDDRGQSC